MIVGPPDGDSTDSRPSTPDDPVGQPGQARAVGSAPADAVVADHDGQRAREAVAFDHDLGVAGAGVLGHVGERLRHHEVGDRLHRGLRPDRHVDVHVDRDRAERGQAGQRRVEAAVGQHRRVHAPDEVAQLGEGLLGLDVRLVDEFPGGVDVIGELRLGPAELHRQRDQPLLRAVVQVTLDPPPLRLGRVHHPLAADLELGHPGGQVASAGRAASGTARRPRSRGRGSAAARRAAARAPMTADTASVGRARAAPGSPDAQAAARAGAEPYSGSVSSDQARGPGRDADRQRQPR